MVFIFCAKCSWKIVKPLLFPIYQLYTKEEYGRKSNDFCGYEFALSYGMDEHIPSIHEGKKPCKCESCYKSFSKNAHVNEMQNQLIEPWFVEIAV